VQSYLIYCNSTLDLNIYQLLNNSQTPENLIVLIMRCIYKQFRHVNVCVFMCIYVCVCVCVCARLCAYMCVGIYIYICVCLIIYIVCVFNCARVSVRHDYSCGIMSVISLCVCVCVRESRSSELCVCVCVCV